MTQAVARAKNAKTAMYRTLVIDAAERLFAERGYEATKIQEVAAASGLSLGTLYSVFDGKAGVLEAIHEERLGELFSILEATLAEAGPAFDRLMESHRVFVRWLGEHHDFLRIHVTSSGAWASEPPDETDQQKSARRYGVELIAAAIAAAIKEGAACNDDPLTLARMTTAIQQVILLSWVDSGFKEDPDSVADRIEQYLRRLLQRSEAA